MTHQLKLKTLSQRLKEQLARAMLPGRLYLDEREMKEVIEALDANTLNEVTLAAVLFGDDATAGKQWTQIIAEIRRLKRIVADQEDREYYLTCRALDTTPIGRAFLQRHHAIFDCIAYLDDIITAYDLQELQAVLNLARSAKEWRASNAHLLSADGLSSLPSHREVIEQSKSNPILHACLMEWEAGHSSFETAMIRAVSLLIGVNKKLQEELTSTLQNKTTPSYKE